MRILAANHILTISGESLSDHGIAVENEIILEIAPLTDLTIKFPDIGIENFGNAAILPGFINAHSHLELTIFRNFLDDVESDFFAWLIKLTQSRANLSDEEIGLSAIAGAIEGIRNGITTFADIGRFGFAGINALNTLDLRGCVYQETNFTPDDRTAKQDFDDINAKFEVLRSSETSRVKVGISPHSPYTVSAELFRLLANYSVSDSIPLSIHAAESEMEIELLLNGKGRFTEIYKKQQFQWKSPGVSPIEYLSKLGVLESKPLLAHCIRVNDSDISLIKESGSKIAHCPKSNAKFGHSIAPFQKFLDLGIKVGIGSDSVASNNNCDLIEESRFANLISRAVLDKTRLISAKETIRTATLGGAECLGLENEIGSLDVGKQADLIVVSLENLGQLPVSDVYSAILFASSGRDVVLTMCAGKELYRNGKILVYDEEELRLKIIEISKKL